MISIKNGASKDYIDGFHRIFGDDYEFIGTVISSSSEIFEIYDDGVFCGGACVLDVSIKSDFSIKSGAYLYGAFICEDARGKGLFKLLCEHICEYYKNEFYDFVLTIPATEALFPVYEHLGFDCVTDGVISLIGDYTSIILPQGTEFIDFDGDFHSLYYLHIQNDTLIKTFDLFKSTVSDFDIKYIKFNDKRGYTLFKGDTLVFASAEFASCIGKKKGLLMHLTDFESPASLLCDILFEI